MSSSWLRNGFNGHSETLNASPKNPIKLHQPSYEHKMVRISLKTQISRRLTDMLLHSTSNFYGNSEWVTHLDHASELRMLSSSDTVRSTIQINVDSVFSFLDFWKDKTQFRIFSCLPESLRKQVHWQSRRVFFYRLQYFPLGCIILILLRSLSWNSLSLCASKWRHNTVENRHPLLCVSLFLLYCWPRERCLTLIRLLWKCSSRNNWLRPFKILTLILGRM